VGDDYIVSRDTGVAMEKYDWILISPAGISPAVAGSFTFRPRVLDGKTVLLRWNGKHNGDVFLSRIGEHLDARCKQANIVKLWEVLPESSHTSQSAQVSRKIAAQIAALRPDIVIGAPGD
jgi:hypothetical protein